MTSIENVLYAAHRAGPHSKLSRGNIHVEITLI